MPGIMDFIAGLITSKDGRRMLFGDEDKYSQQTLLTPEEEQYKQDVYGGGGIQGNPLYQSGSDFLQRLMSGDPELMKQFEQPFMDNFNQNIVPGIAERFGGMGTGSGARSSSGLNNSLAQAGRGLQTDLAALRGGLQMQGAQQGLQYAQQPESNKMNLMNTRSFENTFQPGNNGLVGQGLKGFAEGTGAGATGGPAAGILKMLQSFMGGGK